MAVKLSNNASTKLSGSINNTATSLTVEDPTNFPTLGAGDWFPATIVNSFGDYEIVKVTARLAATFTIVRAQENTVARTFIAGSRIDLRLTKAALDAVISDAITALIGGAPDALNTLKELADALSDDANFAATMTTQLSLKFPKTGGALSGSINITPTDTAGSWWGYSVNKSAAAGSGGGAYFNASFRGVNKGGLEVTDTSDGGGEVNITYTPAGADGTDRRTSGVKIDKTGKATFGGLVVAANGFQPGLHTLSAGSTLTASDLGKFIELAGMASAQTFPLPSPATYAGAEITVWNNSGYGNILSTAVGSFYGPVVPSGGGSASITLAPGQTYRLRSDGFNWIVTDTSSGAVGVNQSYHNVTGSRAIGTTYTNTTGRMLKVNLWAYNTAGSGYVLNYYVGGVNIGQSSQAYAATTQMNGTFDVPPGATYGVVSSGGSVVVSSWQELY